MNWSDCAMKLITFLRFAFALAICPVEALARYGVTQPMEGGPPPGASLLPLAILVGAGAAVGVLGGMLYTTSSQNISHLAVAQSSAAGPHFSLHRSSSGCYLTKPIWRLQKSNQPRPTWPNTPAEAAHYVTRRELTSRRLHSYFNLNVRLCWSAQSASEQSTFTRSKMGLPDRVTRSWKSTQKLIEAPVLLLPVDFDLTTNWHKGCRRDNRSQPKPLG